jgi:hypothetical protein
LSFICTSVSWLSWLLPFVLTIQHTNIHALGGIRTRNPSKRSVTDPRLRPLDHWDRQKSIPGTFSRFATPTELFRPTNKSKSLLQSEFSWLFSLVFLLSAYITFSFT